MQGMTKSDRNLPSKTERPGWVLMVFLLNLRLRLRLRLRLADAVTSGGRFGMIDRGLAKGAKGVTT